MPLDSLTLPDEALSVSLSPGCLAVEGGRPVRTSPLPRWPSFGLEEIEAVQRVLASGNVNYWTGEEGRRFEADYAAYLNMGYAIAVANGTVALELCLRALGVGPGQEVITTSRTFLASASCVVSCGATPAFADVDLESQNLTAESIEECITPRTSAIIAVHLAGWPCDMNAILGVAHQHGLVVIEDCAQAHGARYNGRPVGSMGDMAAFSFCQDKIITTGGEGGMVVTSDRSLWSRAWSYKDHGKRYDAVQNAPQGPAYQWIHHSCGTNWRLTEMQSALGRIQLRRLDATVESRRRRAQLLQAALSKCAAFRVTVPPNHIEHAFYKYYVFVRPERLRPGWSRDRIIAAIRAEGVPCQSGSCSEIYLEKAFDGMRPATRRPNAQLLGETSLMFQVHPTLSENDIQDVLTSVEKVMSSAAN